MKQCFFAVDLGATSGRTILGTFTSNGLEMEEVNRFPNHLIEVGRHFYWDIYELYRHIIEGLRIAARKGVEITSIPSRIPIVTLIRWVLRKRSSHVYLVAMCMDGRGFR